MVGESFFTFDTFGTLVGAAGVIVIVANTIRRVTHWNSPALPFLISLLVGFFIAGSLANTLHGLSDYVLAFVNSCLLFCTATGGQEVTAVATAPRQPSATEPHSWSNRKPVRYFSSWFRGA
ncbi:hypothetical protein ELI36_37595 [Rhizobium ruizarguesonis]|uniref:Uncharacterized protein n=1 Tax=Rhizobium ruizarguesonis TaxID=2081791 RepID=A0ABY1WYL2_9HYPH|nr:hypothetical protein [Rhizobium ruizarguesonis]TAU13184.1 hypothetical protein ELI48_37730 [Rhizobium ruizarguesonis]TAU58419.1 hypothetical protein ELI45_32760 [Rhizobium ruizarguesonis]TAV03209.1 hypothetical protein ELI34_32890 [Rhizobium ruizarguesonis]TAV19141.1 hypothetical protein ELI36_37595 [Rhizobium ruizarguesonis]TAV20330.1 hypothetical protein ELI33_37800 [Rhizobium ruizarguesonis]